MRKPLLKNSLRTALLLMMSLGITGGISAQFMLNCPPNTTVSTDSSTCDALVNYQTPFISGGPVSDSLYTTTGTQQIYVVPANISQVTIEAWGAQGNTNTAAAIAGGLGGYSTGDLAVTPGETLYVYVGGGAVTGTAGGYNGGGNGSATGCATAQGGGGGGGSDVRQGGTALTDRKIVAGGGGGAGGNRVNGCGRGTGGGGGGGYYGGGGGAGWPYQSTVVPTGGTQTAAGAGGTTTYASATNGTAGALGIGGVGGNETNSSQGGSADALPGGSGGGTAGGVGSYSANWTGQSGAGGSGYIGGVTTASMQDGIWAGAGQVRITYSNPFTLTQTAGLPTGSVFSPGSTTNSFTVTQGSNSDSCSFVLTVVDSIAPDVQGCPTMDSLYADANCGGALIDYTTALTFTDNCTSSPTVAQSPAPGMVITGVGSGNTVNLTVSDSAGNTSLCSFTVVIVDTTAPAIVSCPPAVIFNPNTLDCNPIVNFTPPSFLDNCGAAVVGSHQPGANFPVGTTVISYTATDSSGNNAVCSFTLTVTNPVLDGFATASPAQACVGDNVTLQAPPGYTYVWSSGATTSSIVVNMAGDYWVDLTDTSNCTGRDSINVTYNQPLPLLTPNGSALCTGTNYVSYQWYQNSVAVPGATSPCFTPTTDGTFQVIVFDSAGCQGISDTLFFVGVDAALNNPGFEIFPNPAQSQLNIRMLQPLGEAGAIVIYDLTGRVVVKQAFDQLSGTTVVNLNNVSAGTYIVEIKAENFLGRRRLLRME
jgi:hypothetical protein